jgi:hypothetical protein
MKWDDTMIYRSRKHKINPSVLVTESVISAFDDVEINDPDFWCIQCKFSCNLITFSKIILQLS